MMSQFTTLLTSSHLDIKVPLSPISHPFTISQILASNSRRTLFFDESVSIFVIFKIPADSADASQIDAFIKETVLSLEVVVTDTPRQNDPPPKREKFDGTVVYTTTIPESSEKIKEQIEGDWYVAWNTTVPIKHGRTKISHPRVALTAILSLSNSTVQEDPGDKVINADSWEFLASQSNLLAPLAGDPNLQIQPVLPLSRITSSAPTQTQRTKPGRRICRHIFPCGSPLDIRMRYNPLEPDDDHISTEIVLLSVDLSVTPHAAGSVLVKDIKVEMGGGTITALQEMNPTILKRYDVLTLLFRYERYGGDGGRKTVSTSATMIPLLGDSEETSPTITSLWNKVLDIPSLNVFSTPTQRAVSQVMSPSNSSVQSPKPEITGKPRSVSTAHGRAQTVAADLAHRPLSMLPPPPSEPPNLSITVEVPSEGVNPNEEFAADIQVVNRANRPVRLALQVDSGQARFRQYTRVSKTDKLLPRIPVSTAADNSSEDVKGSLMTEDEVREFFIKELEKKKGKPIIALSVETKIG